jgi:hypothetical protein
VLKKGFREEGVPKRAFERGVQGGAYKKGIREKPRECCQGTAGFQGGRSRGVQERAYKRGIQEKVARAGGWVSDCIGQDIGHGGG